jgi:hypothetical protein
VLKISGNYCFLGEFKGGEIPELLDKALKFQNYEEKEKGENNP